MLYINSLFLSLSFTLLSVSSFMSISSSFSFLYGGSQVIGPDFFDHPRDGLTWAFNRAPKDTTKGFKGKCTRLKWNSEISPLCGKGFRENNGPHL